MINERSMLLACDWRGEPLLGWLASQKHNGCRVEWDGRTLWTRHGNAVDAPKWFTKGLPRCRINFELHAGLGGGFGNDNSAFKIASNAVRFGGHWFDDPDLRLTALYLPEATGNWHARQLAVKAALKGCPSHIQPIETITLTRTGDLSAFMQRLHRQGAEGGMFVNPQGGEDYGRTGDLLRWKFEREDHISSSAKSRLPTR